ncbi:similar to An01g13270 [Aspergillus luchuensis]|uniref:Similar to An01g13270 n=1 Tax=Aspergillus kawachii TaxID=1069201 RepID=A0A146FC17_ASPKA|nr:similar to An01g13270 [Aspergillus luchuensis]
MNAGTKVPGGKKTLGDGELTEEGEALSEGFHEDGEWTVSEASFESIGAAKLSRKRTPRSRQVQMGLREDDGAGDSPESFVEHVPSAIFATRLCQKPKTTGFE